MMNQDIKKCFFFFRITTISPYGLWLEVESTVLRNLCSQLAVLFPEPAPGIKPVLQNLILIKILLLQPMEMRLLIFLINNKLFFDRYGVIL